MKNIYEFLEINVVLLQEEIVRTSLPDSTYGGDGKDDWGTDIWA